MKEAQTWYRKAKASVKKEALRTYKTTDVHDLVGKKKLYWMMSDKAWQSFIAHFTDPNTIKVSNSNKRSRATEGAGMHKLGRISLNVI